MANFSSNTNSSFMGAIPAILLLLGLFAANLDPTGACVEPIGICYGMMADNLPSKQEVVELYKSNNIRKMRLYDPNPDALQALKGTNIEVMVGVPNTDLQYVSSNPSNAQSWVQRNILSYWPNVRFKYIIIGNEVGPLKGENDQYAPYVLPSLVNVYNAIRSAGLQYQIAVSTSIKFNLVGKSYPPSEGAFRDDVRSYLDPILGHCAYAGAPLLVSLYPYFSYINNPDTISFDYATFNSPSPVVMDQGRPYQNLFDAMADAVYSALENAAKRINGDDALDSLRVIYGESGWKGGHGRFGVSDNQNAQTYLSNLIRHVQRGVGTPKRPGIPIEVYLFSLFDENQKGPEEDGFGLFNKNKQPKYNLNFGGARIWNASAQYNATFSLKSDM